MGTGPLRLDPERLRAACAEIAEWRRTGVLTGEVLEGIAREAFPHAEHDALQQAEGLVVDAAVVSLASMPTDVNRSTGRALDDREQAMDHVRMKLAHLPASTTATTAIGGSSRGRTA